MQHNTAIGIMDEAYFVPRQQILLWISTALNLEIHFIEDLGTGAVYCQLLDAAFGQKIPMQKVNWKAKYQYQYISNLKIFQNGLQKLGITKKIQVQRLAKARYQDNLQIIQWLKRYIEISGNINSQYPALSRRNNCQLYSITQQKKSMIVPKYLNGTSSAGLSNNSSILNQSILMPPSKTKKQSISSKHIDKENKMVTKPAQKGNKTQSNEMKEIKKILMSNYGAEQKLKQIQKFVFKGNYPANYPLPQKMQVQNPNQEEEVVF